MKKIYVMLVCGLFATAVFAGCAGEKGPEPESEFSTATLRLIHTSPVTRAQNRARMGTANTSLRVFDWDLTSLVMRV